MKKLHDGLDGTICRQALWCGLALLVAGCDKASQMSPGVPASPGTGNGREVVVPAAPDLPPEGSAAVKESLATPQSPGGGGLPGLSGKGRSEMAGRSQGARAGAGIAGGLGGSSGLGLTGSFPAKGASAGGGSGGAGLSP